MSDQTDKLDSMMATEQPDERRAYSREYYCLNGVRRVRTKVMIDRPFRERDDAASLRSLHQRAIEEGIVCQTCQQPITNPDRSYPKE